MPPANANQLEAIAGDLRAVTTEIRSLVEIIGSQERGASQTIIHKSDGASITVGICIACVFVMIGYIIMENRSFGAMQRTMEGNKQEVLNELRDVKAWNEVLRGKVAKLEALQPKETK